MAFACADACCKCADAAKVTRHLGTSMLFLVPSVIYWLHNNVQFVTLRYVDPATYQIMGNLKIVTTGLLLWLCLRRQLSPLQWMALALLMIGATVSQVSPLLSCPAWSRLMSGSVSVRSHGAVVGACPSRAPELLQLMASQGGRGCRYEMLMLSCRFVAAEDGVRGLVIIFSALDGDSTSHCCSTSSLKMF